MYVGAGPWIVKMPVNSLGKARAPCTRQSPWSLTWVWVQPAALFSMSSTLSPPFFVALKLSYLQLRLKAPKLYIFKNLLNLAAQVVYEHGSIPVVTNICYSNGRYECFKWLMAASPWKWPLAVQGKEWKKRWERKLLPRSQCLRTCRLHLQFTCLTLLCTAHEQLQQLYFQQTFKKLLCLLQQLQPQLMCHQYNSRLCKNLYVWPVKASAGSAPYEPFFGSLTHTGRLTGFLLHTVNRLSFLKF